MNARDYEWTLFVPERRVELSMHSGHVKDVEHGIEAALNLWRNSRMKCLYVDPDHYRHRWLALGEAMAAAARAGLIDPAEVNATYKVCKSGVSFYCAGEPLQLRHFRTIAGKGQAVTDAARLYPTSPLASAWLIARDELLERGLIVEGRAA